MNSKYLAGISLAIMASGFIVTLLLPEYPIVFLLKGGFEAGLVGGIADWFAVTALFRHPFGIPIPHTSLLLRNRDKIVQSVISAMENELLNKQSIEDKLRKMNIFQMISSLLTKLLSKKRVRLGIIDQLIQIILRLPIEKAIPSIQSGLISYTREVDLKPAAELAMTNLMNKGYDEKALDYVLNEASKWAERPDTQVLLSQFASDKLSELKMGGFMGFAVQAFVGFMNDEKLGAMLQNILLSGIDSLREKENTYRETILREIRIQLFQLADDDARLTQLKEWIASVLEGDKAEEFLHSRIAEFRHLLISKLEEQRENGGKAVFSTYRYIVRKLNEEPEWIAKWENQFLSYLIRFVENNHYRIGQLVKENVDKMDDQSLIRMFEEKVGKDLQWIRVNGAICGFGVGIILTLIQLL
ncbi:DUF445 domain-containing protein [Paenibacillus sediminis]|uniref:Uncharacterized membrane-anchored protein YjiN (DUF445 family) n=1 Tax=Paenibacillus sediminis TaxID=664909 RepID=A0ABS4H102_9BACL|nr:DUF445 domain-containing protein [Paenibacillus sediminis]MBP1936212.1 uncharacterized membrane-anchored protein YjiN (DUF445 family) [Paenibacillus sediminis]